MKKITLAPYWVRVRPAFGREYENLGSFRTDLDLCDVLAEDLATLQSNAADHKESQHVLEISEFARTRRQIEGIVSVGEYGLETTIMDVKAWKVALKKKKHHADMMPFYFLFDLPEGHDKGVLLLQRTGIYGAYGTLTKALGSRLQTRIADYRLIINPIIPEGALEQYVGKNAKMAEIRFIRHSLTSDISNHLSGQHRQQQGHMELIVRLAESNQFPFQNQIRRYIDGKRSLQNIIELEETRFAYDNVKIKMKVNGTPRMVDLGHPERLRFAYDVSDQVVEAATGHPTFESMSEAAHAILEELDVPNGQA